MVQYNSKKHIFALASLAIFCIFLKSKTVSAIIADFDHSLGVYDKNYNELYNKKCKRRTFNDNMYKLLKLTYEKNKVKLESKFLSNNPVKIPHIIHQIWLGKKFPDKFRSLRLSWLKHHPLWHYILWVDNPENYCEGLLVNSLDELVNYLNDQSLCGSILVIDIKNFKIINKELFDLSTNYGERSDLIRVEILHKFGGLYIDTDFECLQSFDCLHESFECYAGMVHLENMGILANGILACKPNHPIFSTYIDNLKTIWANNNTLGRGPFYYDKCFYDFLLNQQDNSDIIALPPTYFFPIKISQVSSLNHWGQDAILKFCKPETMAIHYWTGLWSASITNA